MKRPLIRHSPPSPCQHRVHVVAHQRAAQQQRMRRDVGAARLLDAQRGEVESSASARARSCSARRTAFSPATSSVTALENAGAVRRARRSLRRSSPGLSSSATIRLRGCVIAGASSRGRDEQQMDGLLHERASADVNIRAVFNEGRVQRAEGIALGYRDSGRECGSSAAGIADAISAGKTVDLHALGQRAPSSTSSGSKRPIDEDQPAAAAPSDTATVPVRRR